MSNVSNVSNGLVESHDNHQGHQGQRPPVEPVINTSQLFQMYDKIQVAVPAGIRDPSDVWRDPTLEKAFYSKENARIVQNGIKAGVYKKSNGQIVISDQDGDTLYSILQSTLQNFPGDKSRSIRAQIATLNAHVIDQTVPQAYSSVISYKKYIRDTSSIPEPMARPQLTYESTQLPDRNIGFGAPNTWT
jgi:hypothetical protein